MIILFFKSKSTNRFSAGTCSRPEASQKLKLPLDGLCDSDAHHKEEPIHVNKVASRIRVALHAAETGCLVAATPSATLVKLFPDDKVNNFRRVIDTRLDFGNDRLIPAISGLEFNFVRPGTNSYAVNKWAYAK